VQLNALERSASSTTSAAPSSKTLERMVHVHANTRLMDKINDVDYEQATVTVTYYDSD